MLDELVTSNKLRLLSQKILELCMRLRALLFMSTGLTSSPSLRRGIPRRFLLHSMGLVPADRPLTRLALYRTYC